MWSSRRRFASSLARIPALWNIMIGNTRPREAINENPHGLIPLDEYCMRSGDEYVISPTMLTSKSRRIIALANRQYVVREVVRLQPEYLEIYGIFHIEKEGHLILDCPFSAPPTTIFKGEGTVRFGSQACTQAILPQWWGARGDGRALNRKPFQRMFQSLNTSRFEDRQIWGQWNVFIPRGLYVIEAPGLLVDMNRISVYGAGPALTILQLPPSENLPRSLEDGGPAALFRFMKRRTMNWSLRDIWLRGNGQDGRETNNGLAVFGAQQTGHVTRLVSSHWGGSCLYVGSGDPYNSNPESALICFEHCWFHNSGENVVHVEEGNWPAFINCQAEATLRGDAFHGGVMLLKCHAEHARYGYFDCRSILCSSGYTNAELSKAHDEPVAAIGGRACGTIIDFHHVRSLGSDWAASISDGTTPLPFHASPPRDPLLLNREGPCTVRLP